MIARARAILGDKCFLRPPQKGSALLLCDYPRLYADAREKKAALEEVGFRVKEISGLWELSLSPAACRELLASLPEKANYDDDRARRILAAQRRAPCDTNEAAECVCLALRGADLSGALAVLQRKHIPIPEGLEKLI